MSTTEPKKRHTNIFFLSLLRTFMAGGAIFFVVLLAGCKQQAAPTDDVVRVVEPDPIVLVIVPVPETKGEFLPVYPGVIRSAREVNLGFPQAGRLIARPAMIGQHVMAHQLLASQDANVLKHQRRMAQEDVSIQYAGLRLAMHDAQRAKQLLSERFVSPAFFEKLKTQADVAQAGVSRALAERAAFAKNVQDTQLYSPFEGVIAETPAEIGQSLGAGQPVVQMADTHHLDAVFSIPEGERSHWPVGSSVHFVSLALNKKKIYKAEIREVSPVADALTRTFLVKAALSEDERGVLPLGTSIKVGPSDTLEKMASAMIRYRVPMGAVYQLSNTPVVWVLTANQRVAPRPVKLVGYDPLGAIVESHFAPNALVVAVGAHLLQEGQLVRPEAWHQWEIANAASSTAAESGYTLSLPVSGH